MADGVKIDTVRSSSSGVLGRSLNQARTQHFVLDSPSGPNEAVTNGEAFLAGISSCGVTLPRCIRRSNGALSLQIISPTGGIGERARAAFGVAPPYWRFLPRLLRVPPLPRLRGPRPPLGRPPTR